MPKLETDIASINAKLGYIQRDIEEIKNAVGKIDDRVTKDETDITDVKTKLSVMTVFSNIVAIILSGAVYVLKGGKQ